MARGNFNNIGYSWAVGAALENLTAFDDMYEYSLQLGSNEAAAHLGKLRNDMYILYQQTQALLAKYENLVWALDGAYGHHADATYIEEALSELRSSD